MIRHYLTVAFRNLRKYGSQTLVSVVGLAVGFACFALAALWIRYEMTYDGFHRDADRIHCIFKPDVHSPNGITRMNPHPLAGYLESTFPEITEATPVVPFFPGTKFKYEERMYPAKIVSVDSSFFRFFDLRVIEGGMDFLIPGSQKAAITQRKAREVFGEENPIGKKISYRDEYTISAVVDEFPGHSNYAFDVLTSFNTIVTTAKKWNYSFGENILIRLAPGTDTKAFEEKLHAHEIRRDGTVIDRLTVMPLTAMRAKDPTIAREVQYRHILIFALSGLLVILCTLFNYLTLFVCRFRIRQKELALRKVCGASERSLFMLLSVEFVMSLLIALLPGLLLVELLHRPFLQLTAINLNLSAIFGEVLLYIGVIMTVSLLLFLLLLSVFRRRSLSVALRRSRGNGFRKFSVVVQLLISIGFSFCTIVILKQMHHLHHTDLGFAFRDRGSVSLWMEGLDYGVLENRIGQLPEIRETLQSENTLVPLSSRWGTHIFQWDGKPVDVERLDMEIFRISAQFASYYAFRLIEGEMLNESDPDSVLLINESAVRAFGWEDPVGKHFELDQQIQTVKGVIRNVHHFAPTVTPWAACYRPLKNTPVNVILFRCDPGTFNVCRKKIEQLVKQEYPDSREFRILSTEEEYDRFLKSENTLLQLLLFVSPVCVLICVFGFVSLVSLTCEERRREMAIRKINGATVKNILDLFIGEYTLLLFAGAVIAFPAGHFVMRRWLEQYVTQTGLDAWIYVSILFVMALVIVLCVGRRVYRAGIENPAAVVKSE